MKERLQGRLEMILQGAKELVADLEEAFAKNEPLSREFGRVGFNMSTIECYFNEFLACFDNKMNIKITKDGHLWCIKYAELTLQECNTAVFNESLLSAIEEWNSKYPERIIK